MWYTNLHEKCKNLHYDALYHYIVFRVLCQALFLYFVHIYKNRSIPMLRFCYIYKSPPEKDFQEGSGKSSLHFPAGVIY